MDKATQERLIRLGAETEIAQLESRLSYLKQLVRGSLQRSAPSRRPMSPARRKAISRRMKAYWASRKRSPKP